MNAHLCTALLMFANVRAPVSGFCYYGVPLPTLCDSFGHYFILFLPLSECSVVCDVASSCLAPS